MAGTGAPASSAGHDINRDCDALQGAPGDDRRQVADIGSTNDFYNAATPGVTTVPIRGIGALEAGIDRNAFCSTGSRP